MSNPFAMPEIQESHTPGQTKYRVKRLGVLSVGIFTATAAALFSFLAMGVVFFLAMVFGAAPGRLGANEFGTGIGALIVAPLIYGVLGFIVGILQAVVYNIIAGMSGGIEIELGRN